MQLHPCCLTWAQQSLGYRPGTCRSACCCAELDGQNTFQHDDTELAVRRSKIFGWLCRATYFNLLFDATPLDPDCHSTPSEGFVEIHAGCRAEPGHEPGQSAVQRRSRRLQRARPPGPAAGPPAAVRHQRPAPQQVTPCHLHEVGEL